MAKQALDPFLHSLTLPPSLPPSLPHRYVNCDDMAKQALDAVRQGDLKILPAMHETTWYRWLENIR